MDPARIRLLRDVALCQSQHDFAKTLGFAKRTIGNAERGTHPPSLALRRALDQTLENASNAQRDRFLAAVSQGASPVIPGTTPMAFPALNCDEVRHLAAAMADARRYLDGDAVFHLQRLLTSCAMADGVDGPQRTLPLVLGVVAAIEQQARQVKPDVRRDLLAVGARGAELAGWIYRDAGRADLGSHWCDRAIEWAQEAGDWPMQGYRHGDAVTARDARAGSRARGTHEMAHAAQRPCPD
jgi:DNA-binding XRE family transcriptional regulator